MVEQEPSERLMAGAERALAVLVVLAVLLLAVFALGMSGVPGEAFGAALDWAIARGMVDPSAPAIQAAVQVL